MWTTSRCLSDIFLDPLHPRYFGPFWQNSGCTFFWARFAQFLAARTPKRLERFVHGRSCIPRPVSVTSGSCETYDDRPAICPAVVAGAFRAALVATGVVVVVFSPCLSRLSWVLALGVLFPALGGGRAGRRCFGDVWASNHRPLLIVTRGVT